MNNMPDSTFERKDIESIEDSEWECYLFGSKHKKDGIIWNPKKGNVPNFFWRFMQRILFGNKWVKISNY